MENENAEYARQDNSDYSDSLDDINNLLTVRVISN